MSALDALGRLIDPFQPADGPPPPRLVSFARWALAGSGKALLITLAIVVTAGFAELVAARFTGWVIDAAAATGPGAFWAPFWPLVVGGAVFFLVIRPVIFAADAGAGSIVLGPHLFPLILSRLNRHTLGHSMRYFENDFAGRISQKAMQTARALTDVVIEVLDVVTYGIAIFLGTLVLIAGVDGRLLLIFVLWAALYGFALRWFIPRVQARSKARAGARTQVTGQIVDTLSNIATVKLFAHDEHEDRATLDALDRFRVKAFDFGVMSASFRLVLTSLGGLLPLFSILGSLALWTAGQATPGDIAMTAMVATRLAQITNRLGMAAVSIFANIGEIEDGIGTLAVPHEITDRPDAAPQVAGQGAVRFENVTFAYGGSVTALDAFDLSITPGEKVALVGASGAGKSTATALLLRLYDVEGGRITLDGVDIRDLTQTALRHQIAVVRQETAMFNRSARENIRYGRPDATDAEIFAAAARAQAHEFIEELVDYKGRRGYDAYLGERGVKLSGGQRQRIALARAILKDAPVLVLDEATSALDSEVEAQIQCALEEVMEGKTVLAIAHRLSTIAHMDRIVVLDHGRIVEEGSHAALLRRDGLYARFWARQSGGFIGTEAAE
ncbi:ABC transporter, transmembrane ATP-binding protein [Rhodovulum sp. P5]|uniref:ABC transporter ATP-binding protein n=1 Tax=Rhodovulum sp. P5 TaxID=1564506 RepID=UPI0009C24B9A|nr:ABC transporter ATP-binding protein [Rhodovulum sp. P5]ARE40642.1 ABC transporter, transmembrane ATP-binding protein [Rhodovulum sp. P5]